MLAQLQSIDKLTESLITGLIYFGFILWLVVPVLLVIVLIQVISIKRMLGKKTETQTPEPHSTKSS